MRGGRNKFGPMYRRERALKQQKKALMQAGRFRLESSPALNSTHQDFTLTENIHSVTILHSLPLNTDQPSSMSLSLLSGSPGLNQHQYASLSNWTITSNSPADSSGFPAGILISPHESYSRRVIGPGPRMPQLVMEFLRCDPDELQLQKKITAHLQQEQASCQKPPNSFSPVYVLADQLLCSIVEWARTSIFFKQLKVSNILCLLFWLSLSRITQVRFNKTAVLSAGPVWEGLLSRCLCNKLCAI